MRVVATDIPGLLVIERAMFPDRRGAFHEAFAARDFAAARLPSSFLQVSDSHSRPGVLRGLHLQWPAAQAKMVGVRAGRNVDVVVHMRARAAAWWSWVPLMLAA